MLRKAQAAALRKLARTPCTPALTSCVTSYLGLLPIPLIELLNAPIAHLLLPLATKPDCQPDHKTATTPPFLDQSSPPKLPTINPIADTKATLAHWVVLADTVGLHLNATPAKNPAQRD
jgi:hypothetical protein